LEENSLSLQPLLPEGVLTVSGGIISGRATTPILQGIGESKIDFKIFYLTLLLSGYFSTFAVPNLE
jgi:hypothetical protein